LGKKKVLGENVKKQKKERKNDEKHA